MPVSSGMGPSGSAGDGQLIGLGVVPVLTTFAGAAPALAGCCACATTAAITAAALRTKRGHRRNLMTLDCTAAAWRRTSRSLIQLSPALVATTQEPPRLGRRLQARPGAGPYVKHSAVISTPLLRRWVDRKRSRAAPIGTAVATFTTHPERRSAASPLWTRRCVTIGTAGSFLYNSHLDGPSFVN